MVHDPRDARTPALTTRTRACSAAFTQPTATSPGLFRDARSSQLALLTGQRPAPIIRRRASLGRAARAPYGSGSDGVYGSGAIAGPAESLPLRAARAARARAACPARWPQSMPVTACARRDRAGRARSRAASAPRAGAARCVNVHGLEPRRSARPAGLRSVTIASSFTGLWLLGRSDLRRRVGPCCA
jgi:hypothetical protein